MKAEKLFTLLGELVMAESGGVMNPLVQPICAQLNLNQCRAKAQLVTLLACKLTIIKKV